ncbi:hypothetical protein C0992_009980, partial [Termitomyces sp. T32_za158]
MAQSTQQSGSANTNAVTQIIAALQQLSTAGANGAASAPATPAASTLAVPGSAGNPVSSQDIQTLIQAFTLFNTFVNNTSRSTIPSQAADQAMAPAATLPRSTIPSQAADRAVAPAATLPAAQAVVPAALSPTASTAQAVTPAALSPAASTAQAVAPAALSPAASAAQAAAPAVQDTAPVVTVVGQAASSSSAKDAWYAVTVGRVVGVFRG